MGQSNYIAAAIFVAFLVFITARGSLTKYIALLTGGEGFGQDTASAGNPPQQTADASGGSGGSSSGGNESSTGDVASATTSILDQVLKLGGPADEVVDGVAGIDGIGGLTKVVGFLGGLF